MLKMVYTNKDHLKKLIEIQFKSRQNLKLNKIEVIEE
jgi:hypothetical protein